MVLLASSASAEVLENFDDQSDSPPFTRIDPVAAALGGSFVTWSYPSLGGGNYAYRIVADASGTGGIAGPSRGMSGDESPPAYTDFAMHIDLLTWVDPGASANFGPIVARDVGLGTTDGYAFLYNPDGPGVALIRINDEVSTTLSAEALTLDTAKDYRLMFARAGTALYGHVYELPDLSTPIHTIQDSDAAGWTDLQAGIFVATLSDTVTADATFDNFRSSDGTEDGDGDGLSDLDELTTFGGSPYAADTDGDGADDASEIGLVFQRSGSGTNGAIGGLATADTVCHANEPGSVAWLSTSTADAKDRVGRGPWYRPDGLLVATDVADLTDSSIANPINQQRDGTLNGTNAWTGTGADGLVSSTDTCGDWTNGVSGLGRVGGLGTDYGWTAGSHTNCSEVSIYRCFSRYTSALRDPDSDDDGLDDGAEYAARSNPRSPDTDGDGLGDAFEVDNDTGPADQFDPNEWDEDANGTVDSQDDADSDGLGNAAEELAGTDPHESDTDDDGLLDGAEIGTGIFSSVNPIDGGSALGAFTVHAADIDGDGDLDALSASKSDDTIAWYENTDGAGTFGSQQVIWDASLGARSVQGADIDGDGDIDVLAASYDDDTISWFENTDGAGTFSSENVISLGAGGAEWAHAADIDDDGDLDVVSASYDDNEIAWYINLDGEGAFGLPITVTSAASGAFTVDTADMDGDGDLDIVSASLLDDTVAWYEQDGETILQPTDIWTSSQYNFSGDVTRIRIIDGSGLSGAGPVQYQVHDSSGTANSMWHAGPIDGGLGGPTGNPPVVDTQALVFDLGQTTSLDGVYIWNHNQACCASRSIDQFKILVSSDTDPLTAIFTNVGTFNLDIACGCLTEAAQFVAFTESNVRLVKFDVDTLHSGSGSDYVGMSEVRFLEAGSTPWVEHEITTSADGARSVDIADIDGDGDPDVVVASINDGTLGWFENTNGLGTFATRQEIDTSASSAYSAYAEDVDGDGDLDVLLASYGDATIAWYENTDGAGSFGAANDISTSESLPLSVHAADVDGDGDYDVMTASEGFSRVAWFEQLNVADPHDNDSDDDGMWDGFEVDNSLGPADAFDPLDDDANSNFISDELEDSDSDDLTNLEEFTLGTDPNADDTDGDSVIDGDEVDVYSTDPNDADSDDDGLEDGVEVALLTDPNDPDTDGDTVCDGGLTGGGSCTSGPDTCPFVSDGGQENSDSLSSGDACQCGDVTDDGVVDVTDYLKAQQYLVGATVTGDFDVTRCNLVGPEDAGATDCDVADLSLLERHYRGGPIPDQTRCAAWGAP